MKCDDEGVSRWADTIEMTNFCANSRQGEYESMYDE